MLLPEGAPESAVEALNRHLGLREPLWVQYGIFLRSVVRGDFGQSFQYRSPALRVVIERVPATIQLALCAMALMVLAGVSIGIVAAVRQGSAYDYAAPCCGARPVRCRTSGWDHADAAFRRHPALAADLRVSRLAVLVLPA